MRSTALALGTVIATAAAGCGSSSSGGTGTTNSAQSIAAITHTWTMFFHTGTALPTAQGLLENGASLGPAISFANQIAKKEKLVEDAKVTSVTVSNPTTATVHYSLLSHGSPLLPDATGTAVLVNGSWKVSESTFCTLVGLGAAGKKIPGCS